MKIDTNDIVEKLQNRIAQDAKTIAILECMVDILKSQLEAKTEDSAN